MSVRGIRGATTIEENSADMIVESTRALVEEMATINEVDPTDIATVLISTTSDIDAVFPAKALRSIDGWTYVPVMCMKEIDVQNSLKMCIRVMMTVNSDLEQQQVNHVYHNDAKKLRPDLTHHNRQ